jgi:hypothetical protein
MAKLEPLAFWELWILVHLALGAALPVMLFLYRAQGTAIHGWHG